MGNPKVNSNGNNWLWGGQLEAAPKMCPKDPPASMGPLLNPVQPANQNLSPQNFLQFSNPFLRAPFAPTGNPFGVQATQAGALPPQAKVLYDAILAYPDSKASEADARTIALNTLQASQELHVDPKLLLAIFAHESQGFDTDAKSHTGAGGLGQLTDSAINETRRLSYDQTYTGPGDIDHYPRENIREVLEKPGMQAIFRRIDQHQANRNNIHDNIWTSTAYARIMMDRATHRGKTDVSDMLERYNAAGGSQQAAYPGHVRKAYQELWGGKMPETLANP